MPTGLGGWACVSCICVTSKATRGTTGASTGSIASCSKILRIKPRKRLKRDKYDALAVTVAPNMTWSMGLMEDRLGNGRAFLLRNVLDDVDRVGLGIEMDCSLPDERVIRSHERVICPPSAPMEQFGVIG